MRGENIKETGNHDAGAIARCSYCNRYSNYYHALTRDDYKCDCGKCKGWTGSFKKPTNESIWSGEEPSNNIISTKMTDNKLEELIDRYGNLREEYFKSSIEKVSWDKISKAKQAIISYVTQEKQKIIKPVK